MAVSEFHTIYPARENTMNFVIPGLTPESSSNQQLHALYTTDADSRRYGVYTVCSPDVSAYPLAYPDIGISH